MPRVTLPRASAPKSAMLTRRVAAAAFQRAPAGSPSSVALRSLDEKCTDACCSSHGAAVDDGPALSTDIDGLTLSKLASSAEGIAVRATSWDALEAFATEDAVKGVLVCRGKHPLADEFTAWVDTKEEDEFGHFADERLRLRPGTTQLSERSKALDDVRSCCMRLAHRLPEGLREAVRDDAESLAKTLIHLCPRATGLAMALSIVGKHRCSRWHQDHYVGRMTITYVGPGTWMVDDSAVDFRQFARTVGAPFEVSDALIVPDSDRILKPKPNDAVLIKGNSWPGIRGLGLTHKSPNVPCDEAGDPLQKRLLLKVDLQGS